MRAARAGLVALCVALLPCSALAAPPGPIRLAPVDYAIAPETVVGPVRVGTLCLPHGKLRWSDVRTPGRLDGREMVAGALREAGWRVTDETSAPELRITLTAAKIRLCVPGAARIAGHFKGEAMFKLHWSMGAAGTPRPLVISLPIERTDPRASEALLAAMLGEAAKRIAAAPDAR